jgi:hypothetical protein
MARTFCVAHLLLCLVLLFAAQRQSEAAGAEQGNSCAAYQAYLCCMLWCVVAAGVVNDEVQRRADDARMGRNPLYCKDHVLLLNWCATRTVRLSTGNLRSNQVMRLATATEDKVQTFVGSHP